MALDFSHGSMKGIVEVPTAGADGCNVHCYMHNRQLGRNDAGAATMTCVTDVTSK